MASPTGSFVVGARSPTRVVGGALGAATGAASASPQTTPHGRPSVGAGAASGSMIGAQGAVSGVATTSTTSAAAAAAAAVSAAAGATGAASPASATINTVPTDVCFGTRIGIRSCLEQRYVAAFPRGQAPPSDGFDLEVSGYHPFRQSDATDRASECPSEWVVLHFSSRQHRGAIRLGDEVCFAKEMPTQGERRKDRFAYLSLGPSAEGNSMEPMVERRESDLCKWTVFSADDPDSSGKLQASTPVLIRGKYNECLALGKPLWDVAGGGVGAAFRSPARASGRRLTCRGRDGRVAELRFRVVKAGLPFGDDPEPARHAASPVGPPPRMRQDLDGALGGKPVQEQEQVLLEDVLFCMLGVDGTHIRKVQSSTASAPSASAAAVGSTKFEVDVPSGADASTVQFLRQILPVCEHHAAVLQFLEVQGKCEYGTVNHALCAAVRDLLKEFSVKVGQLESSLRAGTLSIAKLWYHVQPSMDTMALLHRVTSHVAGSIGGLVLNGIEEVMQRSSLSTAQDLCEFLLQEASRPYFEMVSRWVYEGRLDDTYGEFFISESGRTRDERFGGPASDFWHKHFVLEDRSVPQFLSSSKEKILHAGKYLHVFFSASPGAELQEPENRDSLRYSRRKRDCAEAIDAAYRRASAALLGLFMGSQPEGLDLPGRLESMRSFFFLAKADWFGQLMDTACGELERPAAEVPLARLEGLLDLAIRTSSVASDAYREDISCGMHSFRIEDACSRMSRGHALPSEEQDDEAAGGGVGSSRFGGAAAGSRGQQGAGGVAASSAGVGVAASGGSGITESLGGAASGGAVSGTSTPGGGGGVPSSAAAGPAVGVAGEASGVRCFTLKYRTSWPLSIVFSRALLLKYQMIFRHLLFCRYVERKLVEVWVDHQYTKELDLDTNFSPSYSLRQRMLHFCRDYIYYAAVEVLEPQSHRFYASLAQAETIDEVLKSHERFLDTCLREVLLTDHERLYKDLSKVLQTCLAFAYNLHRFLRDFQEKQAADESSGGSRIQSTAERRLARVKQSTSMYLNLLTQNLYSKMISKFKLVFESQLQAFLRQIRQESTSRYEHFLSNMLTRLDYNEYYSSVLAGGTPET
eukprot:TRINITY_DN55848_c0_g1_i1.p1 TRINITY_DN55848_c0_g1~~TRINITY_DN55848_c0_g1_i1.p1  ORF type:complete len:1101 (-),score=203.50 TRINITY_DN55848_c0_g1_i1:114-3392(-)